MRYFYLYEVFLQFLYLVNTYLLSTDYVLIPVWKIQKQKKLFFPIIVCQDNNIFLYNSTIVGPSISTSMLASAFNYFAINNLQIFEYMYLHLNLQFFNFLRSFSDLHVRNRASPHQTTKGCFSFNKKTNKPFKYPVVSKGPWVHISCFLLYLLSSLKPLPPSAPVNFIKVSVLLVVKI